MGLPPEHRVAHTPVLVLSKDSAWDMERILYELAVLDGADPEDGKPPPPCEEKDDHPWRRYASGEARADISTVEQYFLADATPPVRFVLRRLGLHDWARVQDLIGVSIGRARIYAVQHALVRIDNCDVKLNRGGTDHGPLNTADAELVLALCGDDGWAELSAAAIRVSDHLTDAEKKA